jgi:transcriptional regulator with XRE-family HTH domain
MAPTKFDKRFPMRNSRTIKALAANVKRLRKIREWSQDELGDKIGIEQNAVSLIENGRSNPTILLVDQIAQAFEVEVVELFSDASRTRRSRTP